MRCLVFFIFLLLEYAKASSIPSSFLNSIFFVQCPPVLPGNQLYVLVHKNGKVEMPEGLIGENSPEEFVCSRAANNRIKMWNSGHFREYLLTVRSSSDFITYVDDFIQRMDKSKGRLNFDRPTMLLLVKDAMMLALEISKDGDEALYYSVLDKIMGLAATFIEYGSSLSDTLMLSFLNLDFLPNLPFSQPRRANQLGVLNAIRMVRLSESSHVRAKYDTFEIAHYIARNYKALHPPWMIKNTPSGKTSILHNEPWIKPYLSRRSLETDRSDYLTSLPLTMGITLLPKIDALQESTFYNCLMYIDQITFQMEYAWNGVGSTQESITLDYFAKDPKDKAIYQYLEEYMGLWKELVAAGLANILTFQEDFLKIVITRINIARIHVILKNDGHTLALLDKVERFLKRQI